MKLIIGNWKMLPSSEKEAKRIFLGIKKEVSGVTRAKVVICPPTLFMMPMVGWKAKAKLGIGGQNCFKEDEGAYTGETSPKALASVGARYVILGHSERRALGETDKVISEKVLAAIQSKLMVVLCVGERVRDEHGAYFNEVGEQLRASLLGFPKGEVKRLVIAYEPIWAIGAKAKRPASPSDFREMSILIRRELTAYFGKAVAFTIPILYGGSVDERNAEGFLQAGGADGLLVGRVSLDAEKFSAVVHIANRIKNT
jgi:triosephosphate isomerase